MGPSRGGCWLTIRRDRLAQAAWVCLVVQPQGFTGMRKSYATFGLRRSWQQARFAWRNRHRAEADMAALLRLVLRDEARMAAALGRPLEGLQILEIGPGQGLERARYFGVHNRVVGLDLDIIPQGWDLAAYARMLRSNGFGRLAKTIGRKVIQGNAHTSAWARVVGRGRLAAPRLLQGDICLAPPPGGPYDVVMSWSVFEHLPQPEPALRHVIQALPPGGGFFISLHLFTAHDGHHDMRAFTGLAHEIPLWAHLRPAYQANVQPSAYLNRWRLGQWRELFHRLAPGVQESLEPSVLRDVQVQQLTGPLREELADYSLEELLTVNAAYVWRKPAGDQRFPSDARQPVDVVP